MLIAGHILKYSEEKTRIMPSMKVLLAWGVAFDCALHLFHNLIQVDSGIIEKRKPIQDRPLSYD